MAFINSDYTVDETSIQQQSFEPLPAGWYSSFIQSAEIRGTKSGGEMLSVKYSITGPTHQGRIVFGNFNLKNANADAERIGREQLTMLKIALGIQNLSDTDQLLNNNVMIKLSAKPAANGYDASNDVRGFKPVEGMPQAAKTQDVAPSNNGKASPPWMKK